MDGAELRLPCIQKMSDIAIPVINMRSVTTYLAHTPRGHIHDLVVRSNFVGRETNLGSILVPSMVPFAPSWCVPELGARANTKRLGWTTGDRQGQ
jgi:hypothetical protein